MGDPRLLRMARPVERFGTRRAARAGRRHVRDHARGQRRRPRGAADRRRSRARHLRLRAATSATPMRRPMPRTVLVNPTHRGRSATRSRKRAGKAVSRCPACAASCRAGAASATAASISQGRPIDARGRRLPCARRPARMRSPGRQALSDAHPRFQPLRLHQRPVSRARPGRRRVSRRRLPVAVRLCKGRCRRRVRVGREPSAERVEQAAWKASASAAVRRAHGAPR